MIDLKKLETKFKKYFEEETEESFNEWLLGEIQKESLARFGEGEIRSLGIEAAKVSCLIDLLEFTTTPAVPINVQFAISARPILNGILEKGYKLVEAKEYYPYTNGKKNFARVLIQKK